VTVFKKAKYIQAEVICLASMTCQNL